MNSIKKVNYFFFSALIVILTTSSSGYAFSDNHKKAASDLLQVMHLDELISQTADSMLQLQLRQNPQLRPFKGVLKEFLNKYVSGDRLKDDFIKLYTETFTEQELMEFLDFYKTPAGQKLLKAAPELTAQFAVIGQQHVKENILELKRMIAEEAEKIEKLQNQ